MGQGQGLQGEGTLMRKRHSSPWETGHLLTA